VNLTLRVWRQKTSDSQGAMETYKARDISEHCSFLEMLDQVNETLISRDEAPIAFDHDCREGICGMCSLVINGVPHSPQAATTACQLHMRQFSDGDTNTVEPWRAHAFPIIRDLVVDRRALDRIIQAGGYISVNTGSAPDANSLPISKDDAESAFEAAQCIGCGACVAACPNASAMLFVAAKVAQLARLPQGQPERLKRSIHMVEAMDREGFGNCSNHYECEAVCPKEISIKYIAELNRDFLKAALVSREFNELPPPAEIGE
jgi:succinate dehydrogenase / fumarate reductase iron-sulfur subunit